MTTLPPWAYGPSLAPVPLDGSQPVTSEMIADSYAWWNGRDAFHRYAAEACGVLDRRRDHATEGWVDDRHHAGADDLAVHSVWQPGRVSRKTVLTEPWGGTAWTIRRRLWVPLLQAPGTFAAGLPGVLMVPGGFQWRGWRGDPAEMLAELRDVVLEMLRAEALRLTSQVSLAMDRRARAYNGGGYAGRQETCGPMEVME
jgi:hypothetical protein